MVTWVFEWLSTLSHSVHSNDGARAGLLHQFLDERFSFGDFLVQFE